MRDLPAETAEAMADLRAIGCDEIADEAVAGQGRHIVQQRRHDVEIGYVPDQRTCRRRMAEAAEADRHGGGQLRAALPLAARPVRIPQRTPRHPAEQPNGAGLPDIVHEADQRLAVERTMDARAVDVGCGRFHVQQRRRHQRQRVFVFGGMGDFQHIAAAICGPDPEILVAFAGQAVDPSLESERVARDTGRRLDGEGRAGRDHRLEKLTKFVRHPVPCRSRIIHEAVCAQGPARPKGAKP